MERTLSGDFLELVSGGLIGLAIHMEETGLASIEEDGGRSGDTFK